MPRGVAAKVLSWRPPSGMRCSEFRIHMLRIRWNRRMSSLPANKITTVAAAIAATVKRFIVEPLFPFRRELSHADLWCTRPKYRVRLSAHGLLPRLGALGPKVRTEGVMSPRGGWCRLRPAGAMTEVLLSQGQAALSPDSGSREASFVGINYRA